MISTGFLSGNLSATSSVKRSAAKASPVKFGASAAEEQKFSQVLDAWMDGLRQGKIQLVDPPASKKVTSDPAQTRFTVKFNNQLYRVSGIQVWQGMAPEWLAIQGVGTQESIRYTGAGCFGVTKAHYQDASGQAAPIESAESALIAKTYNLISALGDLAGFPA